jgi:hypothetical protein
LAGATHDGAITRIGADLREWLPPPRRYAIVFAFPPCTALAVSGPRWFKGKGMSGLTEAIELVEACRRIAEWSGAPWMIENPVSTLGSYWRKPDFTFDPYEFGGYAGGAGDDYGKRTCLWTGGGFRLPQKQPIAEFRPLHSQPAAVRRARRSAQRHPARLRPCCVRGQCWPQRSQNTVTL